MKERHQSLAPTENVQKMLISTTSRLVAEYQNDGLLITHAWPRMFDTSIAMRFQPTPISRSAYILAFETPPMRHGSGVVVPDYSATAEVICGYLSVLFGKRFDCHGSLENSGSYFVPDLTTYNQICDPTLPFNSHDKRRCHPVPLELSQLASLERVIAADEKDEPLRRKVAAACKFYLQALQVAEHNPEVAYLHLITAGEILSSFSRFSKQDVLDSGVLNDLEIIRKGLSCGPRLARRMESRLTSVKRTFVKSLTSLLDEAFFCTSESNLEFAQFKRGDIATRIGAAYDLRSKYVHTGVPFGGWIRPLGDGHDIQIGEPLVEDPKFRKILAKAPKFGGLERLVRYCLLKFMSSQGLFTDKAG